jgi:hypothetical protein
MLTQYDALTDTLRPDSHLCYREAAGEASTHVYHAGEDRYYEKEVWRTMPAYHSEAVTPMVKRTIKEMYDDPDVHKEYASKGNWHLYEGDGKRRIYLGTHYVG